ncbi:MAG: outer membrane lipoprotein chaperone LolA [Thermodesulfobacteriota bacterium]
MRKAVLSAIIFIFFIFPTFVNSQETSFALPEQSLNKEDATLAIERIKELQKDIEAITARVSQKKSSKLTEKDIETEGTITLKKPNLLYWEVEIPERVIIVVDGKRLWVYHPALKEVKRELLSRNVAARYTMDFFSSSMEMSIEKLEKRFEVAVYHPSDNYVFELRPKSKIAAKYLTVIYIWYREKDGVPVRFEVVGKKNNRTVTDLNKVSINPDIEKELFHFKVPEGVKIISEDKK